MIKNYLMMPVKFSLLVFFSVILISSGCRHTGDKKKEPEKHVESTPVTSSSLNGASLHKAALEGDLSLLTTLLDKGYPVDSVDPEGRTALLYAAYNGNTEAMRVLLKKGAV